MVSHNKDTVAILNDLIETSKDGELGFKVCAEDVDRPDLKAVFTERAGTCSAAAAELQQLVRNLGGDPEQKATLGGAMHRRWVDIKSTITGKDALAVLNECERGEDMAKEHYERALDQTLPPDVRAVVERQYRGVLFNHDQIRMLRDSERARR